MVDRVVESVARHPATTPDDVETSRPWSFRALPVAAQLIDQKERLIDVSDAWLELTGYRREDVLGRLASSLLSLESARLAALQVIPDLRFKGRADAVELSVKAADGRLLRVSCDARMVPYGDASRVLAVMTPLGAAAALEDYAHASGSWFWEMDAELRFRWLSSNLADKTGLSPEWCIGKTREQVGAPGVAPETWAAHLAQLDRREPFADFTYRARGPRGWHWVRTSGRPVFDADGDFLGYRGAAVDITDEVEARAAAAVASARLQAALDTTEDIYSIWDAADRLVLCNDRYRAVIGLGEDRLHTGVRFEDSLRACLADGLIPSARGREEAWLARRLAMHREPGAPFEMELADGTWLLVREKKVASGETVVAGTDITALKAQQNHLREAVAAAEEANAHRAAFMAQMSHELRTPMNAILGFAEVVGSELYGPLGDPRYLEYVTHIHDSGQQLLDLINDLLDIARIESGEFSLREEPVDLARLLAETIVLIEPLAGRKRITLAPPPAAAMPAVRADRRAVRQILLNLLSNGVKFTGPGGTVRSELTLDRDGLAVAVIDTGQGIAPEDVEAVWQPFAEVSDRLISRPMLGTGLGLSVVRDLMALHQGTAELTSEVGVGTRVTVRFPPGRVVAPDR